MLIKRLAGFGHTTFFDTFFGGYMAISHIFFGNQRTGKTLYLVYQVELHALDQNSLNACYNKIDSLNALGYDLSKPKHLAFTDFDCEIHAFRKKPMMNYWVDGFYLGLPHYVVKHDSKTKSDILTYRTMFLPPYAKIFLDEGNKYFDSRNKEIMPDFRKRWIELLGQWGTELFMVCHRPELVDKCVRDLSDFREFYKEADLEFDYFGNVKLITLHTRYYPTNKDVMAYLESGILTKNVITEDIVIDCSKPCMNITKYYDTHFYNKAFLRFAEDKDFDLVQKNHKCSNVNDVIEFNKRFNYTVPKGLYEEGLENGR